MAALQAECETRDASKTQALADAEAVKAQAEAAACAKVEAAEEVLAGFQTAEQEHAEARMASAEQVGVLNGFRRNRWVF